ncbi:hypothetical protein PENANT_c166G05627 [Penicillium antarcticum]|uniref:GH64 domain-containing protein n=1 Tax=Penicillium antarcticum TaxID=416450 RepID=A0A1V6PCD2_9EURO|nr:hypothetical protein PENANT_c166G05627 [Penicillium antarcticum]
MLPLSWLSALLGIALAATALPRLAGPGNGFTVANPRGIEDLVITKVNILNGVYHRPSTTKTWHAKSAQANPGSLSLRLVNNFYGGQVNAYIQGLDSNNKIVFVLGDGSLVYPSSRGSGAPVAIRQNLAVPLTGTGGTFEIILPIALSSARIYFAEGELSFFMVKTPTGDGLVQPSTNPQDPNAGLNWGFVEFTYAADLTVFANISYVDFVGMILSMALSVTDGTGTQITRSLPSGAVSHICSGLVNQTSDEGYPWSSSCITSPSGTLLRVLSPGKIKSNAFESYWNTYVDQVWSHYTSNPLTINTQSGTGDAICQVSGATMTCNGDNRGYAKPTAADIWGCNSGPFERLASDNAVHVAVIPRLCAAFVRSTLLLAGGNVQPSLDSSHYYTVSPTDHYSRLIKQFEVDGKGYTFPYDDVSPDGNENASGTVSSGKPSVLTVYIGASPP